jgi:predicted nucleotidyltransferase
MESLNDEILSPIIEVVKEIIPEVKGIYLFGSYADGSQRSESDIDIAVHTLGGLTGKEKLELATAFVKDLDVQIDLIDFDKASTLLQFEIISKGRLIYDSDHLFNETTYLKTLGIYYDYMIETREIVDDIKKRGRVYG